MTNHKHACKGSISNLFDHSEVHYSAYHPTSPTDLFFRMKTIEDYRQLLSRVVHLVSVTSGKISLVLLFLHCMFNLLGSLYVGSSFFS